MVGLKRTYRKVILREVRFSLSRFLAIFAIVALGVGFLAGLLAAAFAGSLAGFLVWNLHPAKVFMGDTGSLFIGGNTAEVFGDYASGTNHTLPTLGAARYTGGVWVGTFLKTCTYQSMSPQAMMDIAPLVSNLARGEGLIGHARAAEIRMEKNKK